jgi:small conductance mechanosensitive channel
MLKKLTETTYWENLLENLIAWSLSTGPKLLVILILFFISTKLIRIIIRRFQKHLYKLYEEKGDEEGKKRVVTLSELLRTSLIVVLYVIFTLVFLGQFGVNIAPLLAGAGIVGLAIGFGAQELVRDVISGFFMILENQIRVGDIVNINGTGGLVEKIEVRTITLRDFSGIVHIFQNGKINSLSNMTKEWSAMVFDIGVAYKEDPDKVIKVIEKVGAGLQKDAVVGTNILEPIEVVGLDQFGQSEIVIKARLKTKPGTQFLTGREFRKRLKYAFDQENIEIPFPHRTIYWGEKISTLKLEMEREGTE